MKRPLLVVGIIVASIIVIVTIVGIVGGYLFNWGWTGIKTKTLWDWLQFLAALAIPVVVGFGAVWFTAQQNHDREIAADIRFDAALQAYLDQMSELLLNKNVSKAQRHGVVAIVAQTKTLVFLIDMEPQRKGFVIIFLAASGLINRSGKIIDLSFADLRKVYFRHSQKLDGISLEGANLERSNFSGSVLSNVSFQDANLKEAILFKTELRGADFKNADLSDAILIGANVTIEQLEEARSLQGATMPDGSIHP